jgi:phage/plasmid-associated DNA primase
MLFNLYFGSFKKCKAQGVFGEGPKANDIFRTLLKLDSPTYRSAILKNLEVLLYQPESSIPWNQHPEWFVFTDRIVDLTTGRDITPDPKQYINVSCGHAGYIHLMAFDGVDSASNVMMVGEATANIKQFMLDITGGTVEHFEMANYLCKVMSTFLFQGNMEEKCYFLLGEGRNGKVCFISVFSFSFSPVSTARSHRAL